MSVSSFISEVWSAAIQTSLSKAHVAASPACVNRDYEGTITGQGSSVRINTLADISNSAYTGTVSLDDLATTDQALSIDQARYFAIRLGDIDAAQAAGDLLGTASNRAAYSLAQTADEYLLGVMAGAAGTELGNQVVASGGDAFDVLRTVVVALDSADVPRAGRFVIVNPEFHGYLLSDDRYARADASGQAAAAITGVVGAALGLNVLVSTNAGVNLIAGTPMATTFAEQLVKVEGYRDPNSFSDVLRGLHVYGSAVTRPECLVSATIND